MAEFGESCVTMRIDLVAIARAHSDETAPNTFATLDIPMKIEVEPQQAATGLQMSVHPDLSVLDRLKAFLEAENDGA